MNVLVGRLESWSGLVWTRDLTVIRDVKPSFDPNRQLIAFKRRKSQQNLIDFGTAWRSAIAKVAQTADEYK